MSVLRRLKPAVSRPWLMALAGLMWSGVGLMLCRFAFGWLAPLPPWPRAGLALAGVLAALPIYWFGFGRMARSNVERIWRLNDRACLFSFMAWKSYLIVPVMVTLGITLRNSIIPKPYLAILYTAIGGGLFISSLLYYGQLYGMACRYWASGPARSSRTAAAGRATVSEELSRD